jgi:hypothetical protein
MQAEQPVRENAPKMAVLDTLALRFLALGLARSGPADAGKDARERPPTGAAFPSIRPSD